MADARPAILLGEDHHEYGEIGTASVGDRFGLAISRGAIPKWYEYTDPNEDAVAVFRGSTGAALVAIDGHNGFTSTEVATEVLTAHFATHPPEALPTPAELIDLFTEVSAGILARTSAPDAPHPESRAALSVAFVVGSGVRWAAMGDAPIYLVGTGKAAQLSLDQHRFVGFSADRANHEQSLQVGDHELNAEEWLVLASDGFSDYAGSHSMNATGVAQSALAGAGTGLAGAESLVRAALDSDAADNVAVAVAAPQG